MAKGSGSITYKRNRMIYKTYKFYTAKKQRIAAFASRAEQQGILIVTLLFCSAKDSFSKELANNIYEALITGKATHVTTAKGDYYQFGGFSWHPQVVTVPVLDGKPKKSFLEYMKKNYYRKADYQMVYKQTLLVGQGKTPIAVSKPRGIYKMSAL